MKKHILLIDDETPILELLGEYLGAKGFKVTPVSSGLEARKLVQAEAPHLIITDLQLEDADGLELVEQLKAVRPDTPVLLLTGVMFDPKVVEERLSKKVGAYVSKTAPLKQLLQEVRRLIGPP